MTDQQPDNTAVRVALWRALHLEVDGPPPVIEDRVGLRLAAPQDGWRDRPDMHPRFTAGFRASIVARARFLEDLVEQAAARPGVTQYVRSAAALPSSVTTSRTGCTSCRPTLRMATGNGSSRRPGSMAASPR